MRFLPILLLLAALLVVVVLMAGPGPRGAVAARRIVLTIGVLLALALVLGLITRAAR